MGNCRQDFFIASLYLNTPAKIVPSQEVYTRFGAIDLLAPPAGRKYIYSFAFLSTSFTFFLFRIGILGFLTYKRAMSELSFQEVYITDPLHPYTLYIHTVCVYTGVFFAIFCHFYEFYGFFGIFTVFIGFFNFLFSFSFLFLFRLSLKKEWGVQFSRFPIPDKFFITNKCKMEKFFLSNKSFYKFPLH